MITLAVLILLSCSVLCSCCCFCRSRDSGGRCGRWRGFFGSGFNLGERLYLGVQRPKLVLDPLVGVDGPDGVLERPPDQCRQFVPEHRRLFAPDLFQQVERLGEPRYVELEGLAGEVDQPDFGDGRRRLGGLLERRPRRSRLHPVAPARSVNWYFQLNNKNWFSSHHDAFSTSCIDNLLTWTCISIMQSSEIASSTSSSSTSCKSAVSHFEFSR